MMSSMVFFNTTGTFPENKCFRKETHTHTQNQKNFLWAPLKCRQERSPSGGSKPKTDAAAMTGTPLHENVTIGKKESLFGTRLREGTLGTSSLFDLRSDWGPGVGSRDVTELSFLFVESPYGKALRASRVSWRIKSVKWSETGKV